MPGCICHRSQNRPGERRVALLLNPGKEVIRNGREIETGLLGTIGIAYQIGRAVLLGHQFVAELDHRCFPSVVAMRLPLRPPTRITRTGSAQKGKMRTHRQRRLDR